MKNELWKLIEREDLHALGMNCFTLNADREADPIIFRLRPAPGQRVYVDGFQRDGMRLVESGIVDARAGEILERIHLIARRSTYPPMFVDAPLYPSRFDEGYGRAREETENIPLSPEYARVVHTMKNPFGPEDLAHEGFEAWRKLEKQRSVTMAEYDTSRQW